MDRSFKLPIVIAQYRFVYSGIRSNNPEEYTQAMLFISYLDLEIKKQLYDAQFGGNNIEIINEDK